ncbi:MAG: cbb3-type cytochrome oxidase assembly protein CcoS [Thermodesulfobacteriota bacterium]
MLYYVPFVFLMILTLASGIVLFVWAYRSGQFSDQSRARYLPLRGSNLQGGDEGAGRDTKGPYALLVLLASASALFVFTLVLALLSRNVG